MAEYIGTKVAIPNARGHGILRYYGPIEGKIGIFCGIELIGPIAASRGKNSGAVDGIQYFEVEHPMTGLFLPFERLKTANPHLCQSSRGNISSSLPTSVDITYTPSPTNRGSLSSRLSNGFRSSPSPSNNPNQTFAVPKHHSLVEKRTSSLSSSRSSPLNSPPPTFPSGKFKLEEELQELKIKYEASKREMAEKTSILNELRETVTEIKPLLEEYERELVEKDMKLQKQKSDFDKAREEWRESLDLMVSSQQENEFFYENQIADLNTRLQQLSVDSVIKTESCISSEIVSRDEEISKMLIKIDDLTMEKMMNGKKSNAKISALEMEIKELNENLKSNNDSENKNESLDNLRHEKSLLTNELLEFQNENAELLEKNKSLESELKKIKLQLEAKCIKSGNEFSSSIRSHKLNDDTDDLNARIITLEKELSSMSILEKTIEDLKHELQIRPTFEELTELQKSIDELDSLHKLELSTKELELKRVLDEKSKIQGRLDEVLKISEPEAPNGKHSSTTEIDSKVLVSNTDVLPIYKPKAPLDPSSGKDDWCGLCERDGHSSTNCPYENDMF